MVDMEIIIAVEYISMYSTYSSAITIKFKSGGGTGTGGADGSGDSSTGSGEAGKKSCNSASTPRMFGWDAGLLDAGSGPRLADMVYTSFDYVDGEIDAYIMGGYTYFDPARYNVGKIQNY